MQLSDITGCDRTVFRAMKEKINKEEELVNRKAPTDK